MISGTIRVSGTEADRKALVLAANAVCKDLRKEGYTIQVTDVSVPNALRGMRGDSTDAELPFRGVARERDQPLIFQIQYTPPAQATSARAQEIMSNQDRGRHVPSPRKTPITDPVVQELLRK